MRRAPFAAAATSVALLGACDTITSDFQSFTDTFNPPTPLEAATWAVDTNDAENQRRGIALLASAPWGGAEVYKNLYRMYIQENSDPLVKAFALRALGRHGDAADAKIVAKELGSDFHVVRIEAAKALQRLHDVTVSDLIWKRMVLLSEESDVRTELAVALGQYPTDPVFQALVLALDQRELAVNLAAQDSLQSLTGQDLGLDRGAWIEWRRTTTTPFRKDEPFLYPTFRRPKGWTDYLLFWVPLTFEDPGLPQGVSATGTQRTYEGEAPPADFKLPESQAPSAAPPGAAPTSTPTPAPAPTPTPTPPAPPSGRPGG